jgi:hypothetical protein
MYAGSTSIMAAAAIPTRKVKFEIYRPQLT